jgi:hypothetical protein
VAREIWPLAAITGVDIQPGDCPDYDNLIAADFMDWGHAYEQGFDLVIGNPPYEHAEEFIRHSLFRLSKRGEMIFLLRLAFLASHSRGAGLWRESPPMIVYVLGKRPSFTGNGKTDATDYALFHWRAGYTGETLLRWLEWR